MGVAGTITGGIMEVDIPDEELLVLKTISDRYICHRILNIRNILF